MSCLVRDVIDSVAPTIGDSGLCPDDTEQILAVLNEAQQLLIKRLDSKGTLWYWCMPVWGGCFALPYDCLEARQAWLDGQALEQRDQWWEGHLSVGIQDSGCSWNAGWVKRCGGNQLIDLGDGYPTPNNWPDHANTKLALVASSEGDAGKIVIVGYKDEYGVEQREELTLKTNLQPVLTSGHVTAITSFNKPVTDGPVKAYVSYDHNGLRTGFAFYPASVTNPSFRRKKLPFKYPNGCNGTLLIKGKRRFVPVRSLTDQMQICDTQALKFAAQALAAQLRKDPGEYNTFVALAVNELNKELENEQSRGVTATVQFKSPFGRAFHGRCWH